MVPSSLSHAKDRKQHAGTAIEISITVEAYLKVGTGSLKLLILLINILLQAARQHMYIVNGHAQASASIRYVECTS